MANSPGRAGIFWVRPRHSLLCTGYPTWMCSGPGPVAAIDTPLITPRVNSEASRLVVSLRRTLFKSLYVESGFNSI
ncbi:hypothetical protein LWI28_019652 [Acer negundo]|uniref:Uncharacterized protein n=1 Tax=Acer negundo TaxID=4023 RepID=A0AAD5P3I1_ACENE|nr:hypothetical protein LWI28_019652 [Acer negundo]